MAALGDPALCLQLAEFRLIVDGPGLTLGRSSLRTLGGLSRLADVSHAHLAPSPAIAPMITRGPIQQSRKKLRAVRNDGEKRGVEDPRERILAAALRQSPYRLKSRACAI